MNLLQARLALLLTGAEEQEEESISCADCDAETGNVEDLETHVAAEHLFWVRYQCAVCPHVQFPSRKNGIAHFALKHGSTSVQLIENVDFEKEKELISSLCRALKQRNDENVQSNESETQLFKNEVTEQISGSTAEPVERVSSDGKRLRPRSSFKAKKLEDEEEDLDDDEKPSKSKKKRQMPRECGACGREVGVNRRRHVLSHLDVEIYHCSVCLQRGRSWEQIRSHIRTSHPDVEAKPVTEDARNVDIINKQWVACFGAVPIHYER